MKKPFKPCNKPGCHTLTRESYCEAHEDLQKETKRFYDKKVRDPKYKAFYNSQVWKTVRRLALSRDNHCCVLCFRDGKWVPAAAVDHIKELKDAWELRLKLSNLQSLCASCHNKKTTIEKKKRENNPPGFDF